MLASDMETGTRSARSMESINRYRHVIPNPIGFELRLGRLEKKLFR